jgi:hypothetical protein
VLEMDHSLLMLDHTFFNLLPLLVATKLHNFFPVSNLSGL